MDVKLFRKGSAPRHTAIATRLLWTIRLLYFHLTGHQPKGYWSILDVFAVAIGATPTTYRRRDEVAIVVSLGYGMTVARFTEFWSPIGPRKTSIKSILTTATANYQSGNSSATDMLCGRQQTRVDCTSRAPPATVPPAFCALAIEDSHVFNQAAHRDTFHGTDRCSKPKRTYHRPHEMNGLTYHRDSIHNPVYNKKMRS